MCHAGVGWVMQGWGGLGHEGVRWGGSSSMGLDVSCRAGVGHAGLRVGHTG